MPRNPPPDSPMGLDGGWEAMSEFEGCLLTGGTSPAPAAAPAAAPAGAGAADAGADDAAETVTPNTQQAAAAAGWSIDDMECLVRSIEDDVEAAGWSMDELQCMLDGTPPKDDAAAAASPEPAAPVEHPPDPTLTPPAPAVADNFAVAVRLLSGQSITLQASAQDSLLSLQQRLEALTGIAVDEQRLVPAAPGARALNGGSLSLRTLGVDGSAELRLSAELGGITVSDGGAQMGVEDWRSSTADGLGRATAKQRAQFRKVVITVKESVCEVQFPYDAKFVKILKRVGGGGKARWMGHAGGGMWTLAPIYLSHLLESFPGATVLRTKDTGEETISTSGLLEAAALDEELPNGWRLYEHQKEAVVAILRQRRQILAYDMGLGKTLISLVAARAWQRTTNGAVIVLCPVSVRASWESEAAMVDVVISTHSWGSVPAPPPRTGTAGYFLIADEAHYMQSLESKRTIAALRLCESAGALVLATGTPLKNARPSNLYPLLKAAKHPLAADQRGYEVRYCAARKTRFNPWDVSGAANLEELHEKTKGAILRKTKEEVLELPGKSRRVHQIHPTAEQKAEYAAKLRHAKAVARGSSRGGGGGGGGDGSGASDMSALMTLRQLASLVKVDCAVELATKAVAEGRAVAVCCCFVESATRAHRQLKDAGVGCELLTGASKLSDRALMIERFQRGGSQVFVFTAGAGGVGITLTAASTIILVDRAMTPGDVEQCEDRLNRIGQTRKVSAVWLRCFEVCKVVDEMLEKKQKKINHVLGENGSLGPDEASGISASAVLDQLFSMPAANNPFEMAKLAKKPPVDATAPRSQVSDDSDTDSDESDEEIAALFAAEKRQAKSKPGSGSSQVAPIDLTSPAGGQARKAGDAALMDVTAAANVQPEQCEDKIGSGKEPAAAEADPDVARLMEMGFTATQAQAALVQHPANVEGALTWLLNRAARAKEARQAQLKPTTAPAVPGGVAVMGFKAKSGPVPRSPSVKDSPEPSRGSRAKHTEADTGPGLSVGYCPKWR